MFGALGTLLGRAANTVNNDVLKPVVRDVINPASRAEDAVLRGVAKPAVKAWQTINPNSGYNQAKPIVRAAESKYGFTPQFSAIVNGGNPAFSGDPGNNPALRSGTKASAQFDATNNVNQIQLDDAYGRSPNSLLHESLHREWNVNPNDQQNFLKAYAQSHNSLTRNYLDTRLQGYKQYANGNSNQLDDISKATPEIQNEIHSYLPELYAQYPTIKMPPALAQYYGQFYTNINGVKPQPKPTVPMPPTKLPDNLAHLMGRN